jgi:hypothetical protein
VAAFSNPICGGNGVTEIISRGKRRGIMQWREFDRLVRAQNPALARCRYKDIREIHDLWPTLTAAQNSMTGHNYRRG